MLKIIIGDKFIISVRTRNQIYRRGEVRTEVTVYLFLWQSREYGR